MIRTHRLVEGALVLGDGPETLRVPDGEDRSWYVVVDPDAEERRMLAERLGLHELAISDALRSRHPAKLEDYGDHLFVIAHTPIEGGVAPTRKIAIFLGATWIVSITLQPLVTVDEVEARVVHEPERFLPQPERLMHALLDHQMAGFARLVDELVDHVETLECGTIDRAELGCLRAIQEGRRRVAKLLRITRTQRDVCLTLSRTNHAVLSSQITPYLRDVYDHCLRVYDHLEGVRDSLSAARDGYLSAVNNRLSESMRVLTVIATIMMPLSLLAGVFGMNFVEMPLLGVGWGFWLTVGFMLAVGAGMLVWFRRSRWI
jgi:magnesium transporter